MAISAFTAVVTNVLKGVPDYKFQVIYLIGLFPLFFTDKIVSYTSVQRLILSFGDYVIGIGSKGESGYSRGVIKNWLIVYEQEGSFNELAVMLILSPGRIVDSKPRFIIICFLSSEK